MIRAPKWSGNLSANYEHDIGAGKIGAYVAGNYNSGIRYDAAGIIRQRAYALLDSELSFAPSGIEGLRFVLYGRNLTNKAYYQSVLTSQFVQGGSYADPRTYGARVEFSF
jgi:iron complex outermembrane receptor protein